MTVVSDKVPEQAEKTEAMPFLVAHETAVMNFTVIVGIICAVAGPYPETT